MDEQLWQRLATPEGRREAALWFLFLLVVVGIPVLCVYAAVRLYVALIRYLERRP